MNDNDVIRNWRIVWEYSVIKYLCYPCSGTVLFENGVELVVNVHGRL